MQSIYDAINVKDRPQLVRQPLPSPALVAVVTWKRYPVVARPVVAVPTSSLLNLPVVGKVHAQVKHGVNVDLFALLGVGLIDSLVLNPELRDDIHVSDDVAEVGVILDDLDRHASFALDAIRQRQLDILRGVLLVLLEWLARVSVPRLTSLPQDKRGVPTAQAVTTTLYSFSQIMVLGVCGSIRSILPFRCGKFCKLKLSCQAVLEQKNTAEPGQEAVFDVT